MYEKGIKSSLESAASKSDNEALSDDVISSVVSSSEQFKDFFFCDDVITLCSSELLAVTSIDPFTLLSMNRCKRCLI